MSRSPTPTRLPSSDPDEPTPSGARNPRRKGSGRGPEAGMVVAGKYRLVELLRQGGMGSVWTATHLALDTLVAVKFIDRRLLGSEDSTSSAASDSVALTRARFEREAKAAAQLRMTNVVQVFDYGVDNDVPYLVMELLRGEDLGARLRRVGRLTLAETSAVLGPVARALQMAHDIGLIHRDLKPANIFLVREGDAEVPKVLDFGIAKAVHGGEAATTSDSTTRGTIIGTPHYASPEQLTGKIRVDHRSDLWSLGVVAYRALTGKRPFDAKELLETVVDVCSAPIPMPSSIAPDLPPSVDAFIERAMTRDPNGRFQSARELAAALESLASRAAPPRDTPPPPELVPQGREPMSSSPEPPTTLWAPPSAASGPSDAAAPDAARRRRLLGVAVLAISTILLAALAIGALSLGGRRRAADETPTVGVSSPASAAPTGTPEPDPPRPVVPADPPPASVPATASSEDTAPAASGSSRRPVRTPPASAGPRKTKSQGEEVLGY